MGRKKIFTDEEIKERRRKASQLYMKKKYQEDQEYRHKKKLDSLARYRLKQKEILNAPE